MKDANTKGGSLESGTTKKESFRSESMGPKLPLDTGVLPPANKAQKVPKGTIK